MSKKSKKYFVGAMEIQENIVGTITQSYVILEGNSKRRYQSIDWLVKRIASYGKDFQKKITFSPPEKRVSKELGGIVTRTYLSLSRKAQKQILSAVRIALKSK